MSRPAAMPDNKPTQGLPAAYVMAAAVNAPASMIPSSAILMTPARSENRPPRAASTNGVASRNVDMMREAVSSSLMVGVDSHFRAVQPSISREWATEHRLGGHEQDDDALQ